jgi:hypothetical protein
VLEVNSGVMMEAFAAVSGEHYAIAKEVYRQAVLTMWGDGDAMGELS